MFSMVCVYAHGVELNNQLENHPAPYLALHGDDPVAWQTWNADAMELARSQNKILYLSIGYFACHWCHVMQQESYKNTKIAAYLNENFIPVKVDRELQPALDRRLMDFTQRILGRGGWPLNVFITPTGHPIYSVLYSPPDQFNQILERLQSVWINDPKKVLDLVSTETLETFPVSEPDLDRLKFEKILSESTSRILARADIKKGGFGELQKFPSVPQLEFLLERYKKSPNTALGEFLNLTLKKMSTYGMHDHLLGGFFRYTTDPEWAIPHFEKMLYDNANLAGLYLRSAEVLGVPEYENTAHQTLQFIQGQMFHKDGALVSSFSAVDDEEVEGGSYLWTPEQINNVLEPEQANLILAIWGIDRKLELPAGNHPRFELSLEEYAAKNNLSTSEVTEIYRQARLILLDSRNLRSLPVDDKLLAGWNALALSTFIIAAKKYPQRGYRETANTLKGFLITKLWNGETLGRSLAKGKLIGAASLEDYAYVARALYDWAEYSNDEKDFDIALKIAKLGWQKFYRDNGWYQGDGTLLAPASGEELLADAASSAPSAILISTSLRLAKWFDDDRLKNSALSALNRGETALTRSPFWFVSQLNAIELALELE